MPQVQDLNLPNAYREIVNAGLWPSGTYAADHFGIWSGEDSTAGFADMYDYLANRTTPASRKAIVFGPGTFYADKIVIPGEQTDGGSFSGLYGGVTIIGAGCRRTRWVANVSSEPVFLYNEGGFLYNWRMSGIEIIGNSSNTGQIVVMVMGEPKTFDDNTGGVRWLHWDDLYIHGGVLQQMVVKGGIVDALCPNDFWQWTNVNVERASGNHWPALQIIGQFGQVMMQGCRTGGVSAATNAGPNFYLGHHPTATIGVPTSVGSNIVTCTAAHRKYNAQPVRVAPTTGTVPTGLSAGTTYYAVQKNQTTSARDIAFATSMANAAAGTLVTVTGAGTGGAIVSMWATALASDEYTTEFPHLLTTGDWIRFTGSNLPTVGGSAIANGEWRWAIHTGAKTFKLATSLANAKARTSATITGGTLTDYGFGVREGDPNYTYGYNAFEPKFLQHTSEGGDIGIFMAGVQAATVWPYFEALNWGFEVHGDQGGFISPSVAVSNGRLADLYNICVAEHGSTLVTFDLDSLSRIYGITPDSYFSALESATYQFNNNRQQTIAFSATPSVSWLSGSVVNVGAITAAITAFTVSGALAGCKITLNLVQDGTGNWAVALGSSWKGGSIGSGTAGQKCTVTATFDGTHWMYTFSAWA